METIRPDAAHLMCMVTSRTLTLTPTALERSYTLGSGVIVTLCQPAPGTDPRMQMQVPGGSPVDCGLIEFPERFGPRGTTAEFVVWADRFARTA